MNIARSTPDTNGLTWVKSSYSAGNGGECVEVATGDSAVHIRDSKHPSGPRLTVPDTGWPAFLAYATTR